MRQNRVPARREVDGNMLLAGVENQAVWLWGVPDSGGSPLVWERENIPGTGWTQTGERLDEFLWHFTLADAVFSGRIGLWGQRCEPGPPRAVHTRLDCAAGQAVAVARAGPGPVDLGRLARLDDGQ